MLNEIIFIFYSGVVSATALIALYWGKEALVAYIASLALLANVLVLKQITLFGWHATASDVLVIGSVLGLNLLQEYFGKPAARTAISASFIILLFYTIISQLHLWYIPAASDTTQLHFMALLHSMPRITIASLVTYFIVQHIDTFVYGFLKNRYGSSYLVLRNCASIAFSQLLDTILFGFLGLYGMVDHIGQIMLISYGVKLFSLLIVGPFIGLSRSFIPRKTLEPI